MAGKVLVTGATGNAGSETVNALLKEGLTVRAGVHNPEKAQSMGWDGVEINKMDYSDTTTFENAFKDVDGLFLVAPSASFNSDELLNPVIDYAKENGVKHIVLLSAMGVENYDEAPLRKVEKNLISSGVEYTILRPNWFMQNFNSNMISSIKEQKAIMLPAGDASTSFIDTRDIGAAAAEIFADSGKHAGKEYTLTGSEPLNHHQVALLISSATGDDIKYIPVSEDDAREGMKQMGWPDYAVSFMLKLYEAVRTGFTAPVTTDVADILNREPIKFERYAMDYSNYWK